MTNTLLRDTYLVSWTRDYVLAAWFKLAISSFNDHKPLAEDVIFLDLSQESLYVIIGLVMTFRDCIALRYVLLSWRVKSKAVPQHTSGGAGGERMYSSYSFTTSALDGVENTEDARCQICNDTYDCF
jgi:hypothetical protein